MKKNSAKQGKMKKLDIDKENKKIRNLFTALEGMIDDSKINEFMVLKNKFFENNDNFPVILDVTKNLKDKKTSK